VDFNNTEKTAEQPEYDLIPKLYFDLDGTSVMYAAQKNNKKYLVFKGKEISLPDDASIESLVQIPNRNGVGYIVVTNQSYVFREAFVPNPRKDIAYSEATGLAYSSDGSHYAFIAARGKKVFLVADGKEGIEFDFIGGPVMFSPDGTKIVYRARINDKRFVVVAATDGTIIRKHPEYEMVLPFKFTKDGKSVAYGVKNGQELWWKVEKL